MKFFFSPLLEPVGAVWLLMAIGVGFLLWRRQWRSSLWLGVPTLLLFLAGSTSVADWLVGAEESRYVNPSVAGGQWSVLEGLPTADVVVALGAGESESRYDLLGFAARDGTSRILTAIELVRLGKARTLVVGGHWVSRSSAPQVSVLQEWAVSWGCVLGPGVQGTNLPGPPHPVTDLPPGPAEGSGTGLRQTWGAVTNLGICQNTHDEAVAFRKLGESEGWRKVLLVTSALHMRRSEALFRKQGVDVVPVPADFEVYGVERSGSGWGSPFPNQHRLVILSRYLHEKIGWWVYRWRGWV